MGIPGRAMDLLTVAQFLLRLRLDVKQEKVMGGLAGPGWSAVRRAAL